MEATPDLNYSNFTPWKLMFTLDGKTYVLVTDDHDTVTATEVSYIMNLILSP